MMTACAAAYRATCGLHLQNVFSNIPVKHLYCQKRVIFQVQSKKNNLRHQKARKKQDL